MRNRGYAVYYEQIGPFLLRRQETEWHNTISWNDWPFIQISEQGIHVNYTFMGEGATFPHRPGELEQILESLNAVTLWRRTGQYLENRKELEGEVYGITIYDRSIRFMIYGADYQSPRSEVILITLEEYQEIRKQIEALPLVEERVPPNYVLSTPRAGTLETHISVHVDGTAMFENLLVLLDEPR